MTLLKNAPIASVRTVKQGSINVLKKVFFPLHKRGSMTIKYLVNSLKRGNVVKNLSNEIISGYKNEGKSNLVSYKANCHKSAKLAA